MPLMEHIRELRNRLLKAFLGAMVGFVAMIAFAEDIIRFVQQPYIDLFPKGQDPSMFNLGPADFFLLKLKVAMWAGLILSAPVWLYQIWAFVAPGLHKREKRWAYAFVAAATPLFLAGATLAYVVVGKGLAFLLPGADDPVSNGLELTRYFDWVTDFMLIFGVAFEFPLLAMMLNLAGIVSAQNLLKWWRTVVFLFFLFSAIVTPTPDPFVMTGLAICLSLMYFGVIGLAFLNDKRKRRRNQLAGADYSQLGDEEASQLDYVPEPVAEPEPVEAPRPVRRFDDSI